jgi:hypothetical protein
VGDDLMTKKEIAAIIRKAKKLAKTKTIEQLFAGLGKAISKTQPPTTKRKKK